jgi:hypothetical protein
VSTITSETAAAGDVPFPHTLSTAQAAELLGCAAKTLERAARRGDAPVTPIHVGRLWRWPTRPLLALIHADGEPPEVDGDR